MLFAFEQVRVARLRELVSVALSTLALDFALILFALVLAAFEVAVDLLIQPQLHFLPLALVLVANYFTSIFLSALDISIICRHQKIIPKNNCQSLAKENALI